MKELDKSIIGKKFNRLTVMEFAEYEKTTCQSRTVIYQKWICRCDCGNTKIVRRNNFVSGNTKSCGCLNHEKNQKLKGKGIQKNILPEGSAAMNAYLGTYTYRAKKKAMEFSLTEDEFKEIVSQPCYFCGQPADRQFPTQTKLNTCPTNGTILVNGIDRIDSAVGYKKENCLPCCEICNKAKRNLSIDAFKVWIKRISKHNL